LAFSSNSSKMDIVVNQEKMAASLFLALNSRNFDGLELTVADEVVLDFPGAGRVEGYRKVVIFMKALLRRYQRLAFTLTDVFSTGDRACVVWTNEGEHADGNPYRNSGLTLFHFANEKIVFISDYFKDTSFTALS